MTNEDFPISAMPSEMIITWRSGWEWQSVGATAKNSATGTTSVMKPLAP
jgi:hypothetical protein